MADIKWFALNDRSGAKWALNREGLYLLVRKWIHEVEIRQRTKRIAIDNGTFMATTFQVETNWEGFRAKIDESTTAFYAELELRLSNGMADAVFDNLVTARGEMRTATREVEQMKKDAQRESFNNIDNNVDNWNTALAVAKDIRDVSAFTLVAVATLSTGGAALAGLGATASVGAGTLSMEAVGILAAGSTLKGVSRYQDNGKVGSAVIEGGGTFVLGLIPIANNAKLISGGDAAILTVLGAFGDGAAEATKTTIETGNSTQAMKQAGARIGIDLLSMGLGPRIDKLNMGGKIIATAGLGWAGDQGVNVAGGQQTNVGVWGSAALRTIGGVVLPTGTLPLDFAAAVIRTDGGAEAGDEDYVRSVVLRRL